MVLNLYSIRDKETGFMAPMVDVNDGSAVRNMAKMVNTGEGTLNYAPSDFDLYRIGTFDTDTADLAAASPVKFIINGGSLLGEK